jgi:hypothetical protein
VGGARIAQPPHNGHREEQQDGGERELVGRTRASILFGGPKVIYQFEVGRAYGLG